MLSKIDKLLKLPLVNIDNLYEEKRGQIKKVEIPNDDINIEDSAIKKIDNQVMLNDDLMNEIDIDLILSYENINLDELKEGLLESGAIRETKDGNFILGNKSITNYALQKIKENK